MVRLVAGYLIDHGLSVQIIDAEAERIDAKQVAARILHSVPRLIVIVVSGHQPSAASQQMMGAGETARMIKNYAPNIPIMMMGNHPSALPERTIREERIDFVCDGEGPVTIEELVKGAKPHAEIPGLVWWGKDVVRRNQLAPLLDLDRDLHGNAWHLLN